MRLTEEWKKHLDNNKVVGGGGGGGAVFMHLSKAFDYVFYDFFPAKVSACGFDTTALK